MVLLATNLCEKLPIELSIFEGKATDAGNQIIWQTASEIDNAYFELLKSQDGLNFTAIAKIDGAGNTNSKTDYAFLDRNGIASTSYYQLRTTDYNSNVGHSRMIAVSNTAKVNSIKLNAIVPHPIDNEAMVHVLSSKVESAQLKLYDLKGNTLKQIESNLSIGNNTINLDVSALQAGIYILKIVSESGILSEKVVVE